MAIAVPRKGGDPVPQNDTPRHKGIGKLARPRGGLWIGIAVLIPLGAHRNNLSKWILFRAKFQNIADPQRPLHHHSLHGILPFVCLPISIVMA